MTTPNAGTHHHPVAEVAANATVGEARVALASSGQVALPVVGHAGMLGLVTVESLGGDGPTGHGPPPSDFAPVLAVMDWHVVRVRPDADEREVLEAYTDAAWRWMRDRSNEPTDTGRTAPDDAAGPGRRSRWWLGPRR